MDSPASACALHVALFGGSRTLRHGVEAIVRAEPGMEWIGFFATAQAAIGLCESDYVDVLLIDSEDDPNWKLCLMVTGLFPQLTVVALLERKAQNPVESSWAMLHGARGLIGVDAETDRLGAAIRGAVSFGHHVDPGLALSGQPPLKTDLRGKLLSTRELEVLCHIGEGRTAEQIGHCLGIAVDTARTHVCRILRKLDARDRAHAVALAFQLGLLPNESFLRDGHASDARGAGLVRRFDRSI